MSPWRARTTASRLVRAAGISSVLLPAACYAAFLYGIPEEYSGPFIKAGLAASGAFFILSLLLRNRLAGGAAYFMLGLALASLSASEGLDWLRMAFIPYVFLAPLVFGAWGALVFALAVPLFEAHHLAQGMTAESSAIIGFSVMAGALGAFSTIRRRGAPRPSRETQKGEKPLADIPAAGADEDVYDVAPPVRMEGLMREEDEALRELLRITVFATRASGVSLFVRGEESLRLRCSSLPQGEGREAISPVPRWFAGDALRSRHTIVTGNLGAEATQGFSNRASPLMPNDGAVVREPSSLRPPEEDEAVSIAASPVLVGSMVIGVLAVNSPRSNAFRGNTVTVLELLSAQVARTLSGGRVVAETARDAESLRLVYEQSARLVSSIDLKEIISILADVMGKISGMDVHIYIRTPSGFALAHESGPSPSRTGRVDMEGTLAAMALSEGETRYISTLRGYTKPLRPGMDAGEAASALLMPMVCQGEAMGLVLLTSGRKDPLRAEDINRLEMVGKQAAISLQNSMYHTETKVKAATDALTGLNNRRSFMDLLASEHKRFQRTGMLYAIVLMDVDHFKKVNDTYGHQAGDEVLRVVARLMRQSFRATDCLGRYGGEEFAAVLVDADVEGALRLAERMREMMQGEAVDTSAGVIRVTMSLGVAMVDEGAEPEEVIRRADEALYRAKESGRNRVELWQA